MQDLTEQRLHKNMGLQVKKWMERAGFCRSVTNKLIHFLPRELKNQVKNRVCACHGIQTGPIHDGEGTGLSKPFRLTTRIQTFCFEPSRQGGSFDLRYFFPTFNCFIYMD